MSRALQSLNISKYSKWRKKITLDAFNFFHRLTSLLRLMFNLNDVSPLTVKPVETLCITKIKANTFWFKFVRV